MAPPRRPGGHRARRRRFRPTSPPRRLTRPRGRVTATAPAAGPDGTWAMTGRGAMRRRALRKPRRKWALSPAACRTSRTFSAVTSARDHRQRQGADRGEPGAVCGDPARCPAGAAGRYRAEHRANMRLPPTTRWGCRCTTGRRSIWSTSRRPARSTPRPIWRSRRFWPMVARRSDRKGAGPGWRRLCLRLGPAPVPRRLAVTRRPLAQPWRAAGWGAACADCVALHRHGQLRRGAGAAV